MGVMKAGISQGVSWVKDCVHLFRQNPAMWMLISLAYVLLFSSNLLHILIRLVIVILGPFFLVLALSLYRETDQGSDAEFSDIFARVKPYLPKLVALGGVCMVYSILASVVLSPDMQSINKLVSANADPQAIADVVFPVMIKMLLLLTPVLMVTWFAPMLIAYHDFTVFKAIKSSLAGCLTAVVPLTVAWLLLTVGIGILMVAAGALAGAIALVIGAVGKIIGSLLLLALLLLATSLIQALQYVSYRDVFARKMTAAASSATTE